MPKGQKRLIIGDSIDCLDRIPHSMVSDSSKRDVGLELISLGFFGIAYFDVLNPSLAACKHA